MGFGPINPLTLALVAGGTAASAMGAHANAQAQNNAIAEQNRQNQETAARANMAAEAERERQRGYEDQQVAEVAEALTKANPAKALVRIRKETARSPVASEAGYNATPKPPVKNKGIEAHAKRTDKRADRRTDKITEALAMLTAMGVDASGVGDAIERAGSDISTVGGYRRGSLSANELETSIPAPTVTPGDSMLGDLLMLGGGLASGVGGQRLAGTDIGSIFKRKPNPTLGIQNLRGLY